MTIDKEARLKADDALVVANKAIKKNKTQQTQIDSLTTASGTKQNIVRTSASVVVNAASFTIPTATIDANEALDINNSFGANAVVTLATPTGNAKKDILLSINNGSFNFSIGNGYTAKAGMVILARFNGTDWRYFASENAKQDKVRATLNIANQATNYTIPTVDIDNYQAFEIAQTTAGIVFSLGSPTGSVKKDIQIKATSTADLYINSTAYTLKAGQLAQASFNGTSWNILVGWKPTSVFIGATSSTIGTQGDVPAPLVGQENAILTGSGWRSAYPITDTTNRVFNNAGLSLTNLLCAYSVRKLSRYYTGPAMRVRRSSDGAERDLYFSKLTGFIDVGNTYAIGTQIPIGETLLDFADGADVIVTLWFDQSGGISHLAMGGKSDSVAPKVVRSGVLQNDTENRLSINYNGTGEYFNISKDVGFSNFTTGFTVSVNANPSSSTNWARFMDVGIGSADNNITFARVFTSGDITFDVVNVSPDNTSTLRASNAIVNGTNQHFCGTIAAGAGNTLAQSIMYKNGAMIKLGNNVVPNNVTRGRRYIARSNWSTDDYYSGFIGEFIIFSRALTPGEVAILHA